MPNFALWRRLGGWAKASSHRRDSQNRPQIPPSPGANEAALAARMAHRYSRHDSNSAPPRQASFMMAAEPRALIPRPGLGVLGGGGGGQHLCLARLEWLLALGFRLGTSSSHASFVKQTNMTNVQQLQQKGWGCPHPAVLRTDWCTTTGDVLALPSQVRGVG